MRRTLSKAFLVCARFFLLTLLGQLGSTKNLSARNKSILAQYYAYSEWTRVALDVANQYPGGDYFEFGSEGLNTFCNFLSAFHLNGHDKDMPDVRFFAFDVFGDPKFDKSIPPPETAYFKVYEKGPHYIDEMKKKLADHGLMLDRIELVQGYFKDTLPAMQPRMLAEKRRVGFAFLDCNIASSYKTCFDFLVDFVRQDKAFIYMDEYFQISGVATLFSQFSTTLYERYGLLPYYIRTAGAYGALWVFLKG